MTLLGESEEHVQVEGKSTSHNSKIQYVTTNIGKTLEPFLTFKGSSYQFILSSDQIYLQEINLSFF